MWSTHSASQIRPKRPPGQRRPWLALARAKRASCYPRGAGAVRLRAQTLVTERKQGRVVLQGAAGNGSLTSGETNRRDCRGFVNATVSLVPAQVALAECDSFAVNAAA